MTHKLVHARNRRLKKMEYLREQFEECRQDLTIINKLIEEKGIKTKDLSSILKELNSVSRRPTQNKIREDFI